MTAPLGAPLMESKTTMNGAKERVPLPGFKNLATDKTGIEMYRKLEETYVDKPFETLVMAKKLVRQKGMLFLLRLKSEGRLWRRNDGSRVT